MFKRIAVPLSRYAIDKKVSADVVMKDADEDDIKEENASSSRDETKSSDVLSSE